MSTKPTQEEVLQKPKVKKTVMRAVEVEEEEEEETAPEAKPAESDINTFKDNLIKGTNEVVEREMKVLDEAISGFFKKDISSKSITICSRFKENYKVFNDMLSTKDINAFGAIVVASLIQNEFKEFIMENTASIPMTKEIQTLINTSEEYRRVILDILSNSK